MFANLVSPLAHSVTWNSDTALLVQDFQVACVAHDTVHIRGRARTHHHHFGSHAAHDSPCPVNHASSNYNRPTGGSLECKPQGAGDFRASIGRDRYLPVACLTMPYWNPADAQLVVQTMNTSAVILESSPFRAENAAMPPSPE